MPTASIRFGYGVDYRSFTGQYLDSTGLFKEAVIKQERVRLSERTIAGLERARAHGRVGGRPKVEDSPGMVTEFRKLKASGVGGGPIRRVKESRERPQEAQNSASMMDTADPHLGQKLAIESCASAPSGDRSESQMLARAQFSTGSPTIHGEKLGRPAG
jgi:hypothetical protein